MPDRRLVFLDTETTGLDPALHQVWEIAYAVDDGPILSAIVRHDLRYATGEALEIGGHNTRCLADHQDSADWAVGWIATLLGSLDGATLVGANPAFDAAMLRARWGHAPWHYRLLDIEAYAMGVLGWEEPRGLAAIAEHLGIQPGDHTAAGDVRCLRDCFRALRLVR